MDSNSIVVPENPRQFQEGIGQLVPAKFLVFNIAINLFKFKDEKQLLGEGKDNKHFRIVKVDQCELVLDHLSP